jgi:dTDP-4-dehydrorhamnose 3,5-epimerase-like enzyme
MTTPQPVVSQPVNLNSDDRGLIEQLVKGDFQSVLRIVSKAGAVRANHYHQHDWHICFLATGKIRYVERPALDEKAPLQEYIIEPGQLFYTAPMLAHAMEFMEDSEFYCFTPRSGGHDDYENDIIRIMLIDPKEAASRYAGR